jgi:hypothetical protein
MMMIMMMMIKQTRKLAAHTSQAYCESRSGLLAMKSVP